MAQDPLDDKENRKRRRDFDRMIYWVDREEQLRPEEENSGRRALRFLALFILVLTILLVIVWAGAFIVVQHSMHS